MVELIHFVEESAEKMAALVGSPWKSLHLESRESQLPIPRWRLKMTQLRDTMIKRMELRNFSQGTIRIYLRSVKQLAGYYRQRPDTLTASQVQDYLYYLLKERQLAWSTIHTNICGLKFFYHDLLGRSLTGFYIPAPRQEKRLPVIWSPEEIRKLASAAPSLKIETMILLTYATGMRCSEVVHLKVGHIDSKHMTLWIRQGKGKKDRAGLLTPSLLATLRKYWRSYRPAEWLFPSVRNPDRPLNSNTFSVKFSRVKNLAGFNRPGSVHTLRHSFATHLVAQGVDILTVSKLLGHANLSTTMIYCHLAQSVILSKAKSLDLLQIKTLSP